MSEVNKTIQINPTLFKIGGKSEKKKKEKKQKPPKPIVKPSVLRENMLRKIKEHKEEKKRETEKLNENDRKEEKFSEDFNSSMDYLKKLSAQERQEKKSKRMRKKNKTMRNSGNRKYSMITTDVNNREPPYGNLKGGKKPLYRTWKRRNETNEEVPSLRINDYKETNTPVSNNEMKIEKFRNTRFNLRDNKTKSIDKVKGRKYKKYRKTTFKKTFKLGKKNGKVSVLVNNNTTRKNLRNEKRQLENKPISEIKTYLQKHNLIKIGTTAPPDVMRKIYESSVLAGDIYNKSGGTLIHNYMNTEDNKKVF